MSVNTNDPADFNDLVYAFPRNEGEEVQFMVRRYKGRTYADLRLWYQGESADGFKPTQKGISLPLERVPELWEGVKHLADAVQKVLAEQTLQSKKSVPSYQKPEKKPWVRTSGK